MEKKCALIYNRNSSGFKQRNFLEILRTIRKMGIMPIPIDSHHPNFIIENLPSLNEKFDYVLTMGGDGTVNKAYEAYNQLEDEQNAIYGHIPMGTTNDMGPNTNVPRYNPKKATSLLLSGQIEERDIITLNNRAIAYVGAMGILAPVTYLIDKSGDKKDAGTFSYIRYGAKEFFTNPELYKNIVRDPFQITYEANGNSVSTSAIFIAIFNAKSFANLPINPQANMTNGTFDVVIIHDQKDLLKLLALSLVSSNGCMDTGEDIMFTTDHLSLSFENKTPVYPVNCDGDAIEILGSSNTLEAKTAKKVKQLTGIKR